MIKTLLLILVGTLGASALALDTSSFYKRKWNLTEAQCKSNGKKIPVPSSIWVFHKSLMLDYSSGTPVQRPFKFKGETMMIEGFDDSAFLPIEIKADMFTLTFAISECPEDNLAEIIFRTVDPNPGRW